MESLQPEQKGNEMTNELIIDVGMPGVGAMNFNLATKLWFGISPVRAEMVEFVRANAAPHTVWVAEGRRCFRGADEVFLPGEAAA